MAKLRMLSYILCRILLIFPTLLGILALNFLLVQAAPGGPVERMIAQIKRADQRAENGYRQTECRKSGPRDNLQMLDDQADIWKAKRGGRKNILPLVAHG